MNQRPATGGRFVRDPQTGELKTEAEAETAAKTDPEPAAPEEDAPARPRKRT